jgi:hypothetical protein
MQWTYCFLTALREALPYLWPLGKQCPSVSCSPRNWPPYCSTDPYYIFLGHTATYLEEIFHQLHMGHNLCILRFPPINVYVFHTILVRTFTTFYYVKHSKGLIKSTLCCICSQTNFTITINVCLCNTKSFKSFMSEYHIFLKLSDICQHECLDV